MEARCEITFTFSFQRSTIAKVTTILQAADAITGLAARLAVQWTHCTHILMNIISGK